MVCALFTHHHLSFILFTESATSCGAPAFVSDAVIIHKYQDIFGDKQAVEYKCMDSYTLEGSIISVCEEGEWSPQPKCRK